MDDMILDARDLNTYYGQVHALKKISVQVAKGRFVSVIGANGAMAQANRRFSKRLWDW